VPGLMAGAARAEISPDIPTPLAGYPPITVQPGGPQDHQGYQGRTGSSLGIADPIHARALAVTEDGATALLITLDVCIVPGDFSKKVRARIAHSFQVPYDSVLVAASHNHSGPDFSGYWEPVDPSVEARLADAVVGVAGEALLARVPARMGYGAGRLPGVTVNRRDPQRPVDTTVPVLRVEGSNGACLAVLFGFACHPVTAGAHNRLISAEYPGAAARVVESQLDGAPVALFLNGGAGNINPRAFPYAERGNVVQWARSAASDEVGRRVRSLNEARRLGTALGGEVLRVAACTPTTAHTSVRSVRLDVAAEIKPHDQLEAFIRHMPHSPAVVDRWRQNRSLITEVMAVRIGPLVLLAMPGEPFVETALQLQRDTAADSPAVRLVGYANDYPGYLTPPDQMVENRYESVATPLSARGVEAVIEATHSLQSLIDVS
jgi:neutral ceramidase